MPEAELIREMLEYLRDNRSHLERSMQVALYERPYRMGAFARAQKIPSEAGDIEMAGNRARHALDAMLEQLADDLQSVEG